MPDTTTAPTPADLPIPPPAAATTEPETAPDAPLGDSGKRALDAERSARKAAEKSAAEYAAKLKAYQDAEKSEQERLSEQLEAYKAEAATAKAEALRLKVAAEEGIPPNLHEFLVGDNEEQLRAKAQKLAAMAQQQQPARPAPDPTQGAKPSSGPSQLSRADLARMSPDEIVTARSEGRLNDLLGIRT